MGSFNLLSDLIVNFTTFRATLFMLFVSGVNLRFLRQKCLAPYWRKNEVKEFCNVRLANEAKMVAPVTKQLHSGKKRRN